VAPWFVSAPENVEVREGQVLQITVSFGGSPEPLIEWARCQDGADGATEPLGPCDDQFHTVEVISYGINVFLHDSVYFCVFWMFQSQFMRIYYANFIYFS